MNSFKEICKALLDEIPYESPTTCLAREALLNCPGTPMVETQNQEQVSNLLKTVGDIYSRYGWIPEKDFICLLDEMARQASIIEEGCDCSLEPEVTQMKARAVLERWGNLKVEPVPVSEKPWECPGWCDKRGRCWAWSFDLKHWQLIAPQIAADWVPLLPFNAIPFFGSNNKTGGEQ